ncbi:ABC transporter ATP-binding protein, partial [candidate division WOR-3 bacterium]|nr:ABC transporter ATP-binding protein [candidate division WOR-3 bacterium]
MNVLKIENLVKIYYSPFLRKKTYGLRGLNLEVKEGEIFGLLGPNGAGKTTTLKTIVGILKPTSGRIKLFESYNIERKKSLLGFLPENPYFYRHLTGYELLLFYSKIFKEKKSRKEIYSLLDRVGVKNAAHKKIGNYSKGMLQRIGLAQAIINDPAFVILDEPMSGLDPIGRKEIKDLIFQLKQSGKTILFSSHILPDVEEICERVGILM